MSKKTGGQTATQAPRPRLSRELVLHTAVDYADKNGIASLTMRKLAQELSVEAMSLYHHIANKDVLLDDMIELVFAEIALPSPEVGWKPALRARSISVRAALIRHRWATGLMESRTAPGPATLRHHEAVLGCLRKNGFAVAAAAHAYSLLDSYIYGFVLQEISLPFTDSQGAAEVAATIFEHLSAQEYPYFTEIAREHVLQPGYAYADEYEIGLDLVMSSIESLLNEKGPNGCGGYRP